MNPKACSWVHNLRFAGLFPIRLSGKKKFLNASCLIFLFKNRHEIPEPKEMSSAQLCGFLPRLISRARFSLLPVFVFA
jgi:hypothetical protein